ncbi:hypothetical protein FOS14_22655 [Skermania sp. ID1734]|uniref:hypothetical protein n=1 Tax=Skermania sp. ID1734 TaxID=2597516 RepID=UPI00117D138D|nr:hypothetical protein [Skermania sp. ID1734]TSD93658.1 hypothetical protein FOS14_22655 [Skermania sp. ID1734]
MNTLTRISILSVVCAALVWLYVLPQVVTTGLIEPGPLLGVMVVLPFPIGLIAALIGAGAGVARFVERANRTWAVGLMMLGHIVTWILAIWIAVWATNWGSTGWELLTLPASLMVGQLVVAAGLVAAIASHRSPNGQTGGPLAPN